MRPVLMGDRLYHVSLPVRYWHYLDHLSFCSWDVEVLLKECGQNLIDDDPSYTLRLWLYWISENQHVENGVSLKQKPGLPLYRWFEAKRLDFHNMKYMQIDESGRHVATVAPLDRAKPVEADKNAVLSVYDGRGEYVRLDGLSLDEALKLGDKMASEYRAWKAGRSF